MANKKPLIMNTDKVISITGKSERSAQYMINKIKKALNKEKHQAITVKEFCEYHGLNRDEVEPYIQLFTVQGFKVES